MDFAELCIAGVREGAARTAGGREEARTEGGRGGGGGAQGAMPMRLLVAPSPRCTGKGKGREGKGKEGWLACRTHQVWRDVHLKSICKMRAVAGVWKSVFAGWRLQATRPARSCLHPDKYCYFMTYS